MVPYALITGQAGRLGLTAQQILDLPAFLARWNLAYAAYLSPLSYGRLSTAQINALYREIKIYMDALKQQLKNNPSLVLTEADYIFFDIHKDAVRRGNIPAPTEEAGVESKNVAHLNNEYRAYDVANPTKAGKPKDVKRIKVKLLVLKAITPPPTIDMLVVEMESGAMLFDIPFTIDQVGWIAYVAICFVNDSGESEYSAIIATPII